MAHQLNNIEYHVFANQYWPELAEGKHSVDFIHQSVPVRLAAVEPTAENDYTLFIRLDLPGQSVLGRVDLRAMIRVINQMQTALASRAKPTS